jgi:hypothetical protein
MSAEDSTPRRPRSKAEFADLSRACAPFLRTFLSRRGYATRRQGGRLLVGKPDGSRLSFHAWTIWLNSGRWRDYSTGRGGDAVQLIEDIDRCRRRDAIDLAIGLSEWRP